MTKQIPFSFEKNNTSYKLDYISQNSKYIHNVAELIEDQINKHTDLDIIKDRVTEALKLDSYKVVGLFEKDKLVGVIGLWYMIRHYSGRSVEIDHFVIDSKYQKLGLGTFLLKKIIEIIKSENQEAVELNAYIQKSQAHKFYLNHGFEIKGFHHTIFNL